MSLLHMTTDAGATAGGSQMASTAGSPPFEKKKTTFIMEDRTFSWP